MVNGTIHVLVTNDDGVMAEGLIALRSALLELGVQVTVIAPDGNRSGMARAISFDRPVTLSAAGGTERDRIFATTGTPVDCVRLGLLSDVVPAVDVVASGINHGLNVGDDVTYSGTFGAALEAAILGVPGVAISQQADDGSFRFNDSVLTVNFRHAHRAAEIVLAVSQHAPPERTALNINLPAGDGTPRIALTRPGRRTYARGLVRAVAVGGDDPSFYPYGLPHDPAPPFDDSPGTDFAALTARQISVSLLAAGAAEGASPAREAWFGTIFGDGGMP